MKHLLILLLLLTSILSAQTKEITGKITTLEGTPLSLANIKILNSKVGTVSNINGEFILKAEFNVSDIVQFSYVGYKSKKINIGDLSFSEANIVSLEKLPYTSQTVLVEGSIGEVGVTPMAFAKVTQENIEESYVHQDVPEYLSYLPSTTFYSESGNGIGYNYLSIRGFDQRRIAISVNGIPQNDPEDNNVYWHDMPNILSSVGMIQVQRGAGAGVIGYPAVGGSINIITSNFSDKPTTVLGVDIGNYNTRKYSAAFGSGLINDNYSIYINLSKTLSDGYRDLSWVDFNSFYLSAVRYDKNITSQINIYGGPISDGLVYTGLPKEVIKNRELRKANYSYWEWDKENNKFQPWSTKRKATEIEEFSQPHFELLNEAKISENVTLNSALFLVIGDGFFDYDGSWAIPDYGYSDYFRLKENGFDSTKIPTNALIRATVENTQWGWIPRISVKHENGNLILGGEFRIHRSNHYGNINFAENLPSDLPADYQYYFYNGSKDIVNVFAHEQYQINNQLNVLAELQLSYHKYKISNEKYVGNNFSVDGLYLNPRIGINYLFSKNINSYFSIAQVTREPRLKNYYDVAESSAGEVPQFEVDANGNYNFEKPLVNPETMNSFEVGTSLNNSEISFNANVFYMIFTNEIVKSGQLDRFGQPITGNMDKTTHTGIELSGTYKISEYLDFAINGTFSKNEIAKGFYYNGSESYNLKNNSISGFPDITANGIIRLNCNGLFAQLWLKYVGGFYTDNFGDISGITDYDNKVDAYFVSNALVSYQFKVQPVFNSVKLFVQVNNIFDNLYAAYGTGNEFFPAAERNITAGIKVGI
ncbi:MAG: TonB-dependent receptor [Bacteroidetes bacterium]|nr:TonB-dependent receptor [Bacteroidota bacterium]MBU1116121.1 TonB-dependent receptor [Bacteroidota bacterium]MBU1800413.1 TonB-dependent receptor [Bacteroidota bacterium]